MKKILTTCVAYFLAGSLYSQTLKPEQYAVLPKEEIQIDKFKKKDGTYPIPYLTNQENLAFSTNGEYLYICNADEKIEGKFIVYDVAKKSIVKTFKLPKVGIYYASKFTFNPNNIYQLAVAVAKEEIIVLPDWRTEPDDAFAKKKPAGSNRISVTGKMEYAKFTFSNDGKSLYINEDDMKIVNLADGKATNKKLPITNKVSYFKSFIGNDEALIINQKDEKSLDKSAQIYHIPSGEIVRNYDISGSYGSPSSYTYISHILCIDFEGFTLNLQTGEKDFSPKKIRTALVSAKNNSSTSYPVLNNGYVVTHLYYKEESVTNIKNGDKYTTTTSQNNLHFFNKNAANSIKPSFADVNREVPWTDLQNLQISPNGKYMVFRHVDNNNDKNSRWILATL